MFDRHTEKSKREIVYEAICDCPSDQLIRYEDLPFDVEVIRGLRSKVARTFEKEQQRTVVCVQGEGWKIVRGIAQVQAASRKRRLATRRMGHALHTIATTDRREMNGEERLRADQELITIQTSYGILRGLATKHSRLGLDEIKRWQEEHPA